MKGTFVREGNVGQAPELKKIPSNVEGQDEVSLCSFSVRFDNQVKVDDGYEDKGGFWMDVDIWGKPAENLHRVLKQGLRVLVVGHQIEETWKKDDVEHSKLKIKANAVYLVVNARVDSINLVEKS